MNALAAENEVVLPAGGIGPLTAQATEVHFSETPSFHAIYHSKQNLWKLVFALEQSHQMDLRKAQKSTASGEAEAQGSEGYEELSDEDKAAIAVDAKDETRSEVMDGNIKQAKLLVTGDQWVELPYLVDGLRTACGNPMKWNTELNSEDRLRVDAIRSIYRGKSSSPEIRKTQGEDKKRFRKELHDHAAGFLSPLISQIKVGWPSKVLEAGVTLVDLPGVGIANDSYRKVTSQYVQEKARAVILVVDRAGPTEASIELLRNSGYWARLLGATDDPDSDPCSMLVAVTKVDDVAEAEWQKLELGEDGRRPKKKVEVYEEIVGQFLSKMKEQVTQQLAKLSESAGMDAEVKAVSKEARENILKELEIHPLSAPEYQKLLKDDEENAPRILKSLEMSGIPRLQNSLISLAHRDRDSLRQQIDVVAERLGKVLANQIAIVDAQWQSRTRAAEEAEKLAAALQEIMDPKRREYDRRVGGFREYLDSTVQVNIQNAVNQAKDEASREVNHYLLSLQDAHWGTLRAAVLRGGSFIGSRSINLPDDIAVRFQEPMAAIWGKKLLKDIRDRTTALAKDTEEMVQEICDWAKAEAGAHVNPVILETQSQMIQQNAAQMKQVGRDAVDDLRSLVKAKLLEEIRTPIRSACEKFVEEGDHQGPGVKARILFLFQNLSSMATEAAKKPAINILKVNFQEVREEIRAAFNSWGQPLEDTANLIVEKHEDRVKRSDAQRRNRILENWKL
ncbi:MAG: hypothetical protein IPN71_14930 [Fibrobacteres bacterium]|nr:hypothetical protein [Fibrobacterota bacterium]